MQYLEIILFIFLIVSVFSFISLAPWMPSRKSDYGRIRDIVKLQNGEKFLEMGCGTAGVSLFIAKSNPQAQVTAVELSPLFYIISKIRAALCGSSNLRVIYGNALKLDLTQYDVIYVFGLPDPIIKKIFPLLSNINKKNFRFISYCFEMKNEYFRETKHKPSSEVYAIYEYNL